MHSFVWGGGEGGLLTIPLLRRCINLTDTVLLNLPQGGGKRKVTMGDGTGFAGPSSDEFRKMI
jgi:hypothetical protein